MNIRTTGQGKKLLVSLLVLLTVIPVFADEAFPPADELLQPVRLSQFPEDMVLAGHLRSGRDKSKFTLQFENGNVIYNFRDPVEKLIVGTGDQGGELTQVINGKAKKVSDKQAIEPFRGTDVTLEDVSLRCLYWTNVKTEGERLIGPRSTWMIRLTAPRRSGNYAAVFAWVDKKTGALMQMDAHDWDGKFVKRFKVVSGQKIDGLWALKQMRVESMKPGTKKVLSRTYMEITGKKE